MQQSVVAVVLLGAVAVCARMDTGVEEWVESSSLSGVVNEKSSESKSLSSMTPYFLLSTSLYALSTDIWILCHGNRCNSCAS